MSNQIDTVIDLGVVPPALSQILSLRRLVELATAPPRQVSRYSVELGEISSVGQAPWFVWWFVSANRPGLLLFGRSVRPNPRHPRNPQ